jgi:hypothetical protein
VEFAHDPHAGAPSTLIYVDAPQSQPLDGGEFTIEVGIRRATNLGAFMFVLSTGSSDLRVTGVREARFLGSSGREVRCEPPAIGESEVTFLCVTLRDLPAAGVSGAGALATVRLAAEAPGVYQLELLRTQAAEPSGAPILGLAQAGGTFTVR